MIGKLLLILTILILIPVGGQAVKLTPTPITGTTEIEQLFTYNLHIENDGSRDDAFVISVSSPRPEWVNLDRFYVMIDAYNSKDVGMVIYPKEKGSYIFEIEVFSVNDPDMKANDDVYLSVIASKEIEIKTLSAVSDGATLLMSLDIFSLYRKSLYIDFEIADEEGNRVKYLTKGVEAEGNQLIEEEVYVGDLPSGKYTVKASIPDLELFRQSSFDVSPFHNVVKTVKTSSNPFVEEIEILVENKGNTEENYLLKEIIPSSQWVTFVDNPDNELADGAHVTYQWMLKGLATGEPVSIKYRIEHWPGYVLWFVVGICILGVIGISLMKVSKPSVKKHYFKKRGEKIIVLEVKGSLSRHVKSVMVKDSISPLARVDQNFDGPKPIVRVSDSGTELIWRLGDLKARGEVLLSYRVKPLMEADLKMPRAHLTFRDDSDRKFRVSSKQVLVN
ncbi:MAG: hypothetical protein JW754_03215 [Candidatus Aenigmarchaeota archaeon]|nr:hypothetical protein [Candidatus Aenigmarchaeota archaeon]